MNGNDIKRIFEEIYPTSFAYNWDNVGLQVGTLNKDINNILLSLDLTEEVIKEAIKKSVELIIVHHPMIFSGIKSIKTDSPIGKMISLLIKNDITLYVAHTNFDISNRGMNRILADMLDIHDQEILEYTTDDEGLGIIGNISEKTDMSTVINNIKSVFNISTAKLIGDINKKVKRIAIAGGSGSSLINLAKVNKADLYISGDITYHHALEAKSIGLNVLDIGHNIEKNALPKLQSILCGLMPECEILLSEINTNPYKEV